MKTITETAYAYFKHSDGSVTCYEQDGNYILLMPERLAEDERSLIGGTVVVQSLDNLFHPSVFMGLIVDGFDGYAVTDGQHVKVIDRATYAKGFPRQDLPGWSTP